MATKKTSIISCAVVAVCLFLFFLLQKGDVLSDDELRVRTEASQPTWQNYIEDIKGQVGARYVAEWSGGVEQAGVAKDESRFWVSFHVEGAWAGRDAAIPVLLREPRGNSICSSGFEKKDGDLKYFFDSPYSLEDASVPWLEVKHPAGEHRITLSQ